MTGSRNTNKCFLSLGSNLGDRNSNLSSAITILNGCRAITVTGKSSVIETEPVDYYEQPSFLNQIISVETTLTPRDLLETILDIENQMGRKRIINKGPRLIDIDILFYGDYKVSEPDLVIPHKEIENRTFILFLLKEFGDVPVLIENESE